MSGNKRIQTVFLAAALLLLAALPLLKGCGTRPPAPPPPYSPPASPYAPADFRMEGDYLACTAGPAVAGIDVSSHQGEIDWQAVADAGIRFAYIRLGYRGYNNGELFTDEYAAENLAAARAAGLKTGAYFFSQAVTVEEAREEADYALSVLDGAELELPLVYDWEFVSAEARTGQIRARELTDFTLAFCRTVEAAGYAPMVYFNTSQGRDLLLLRELEQYPWWLAKYDLEKDFLCRVDQWQYTCQGTVPGIRGNVDIDLLFTAYGLGQEIFGDQ